MLSDRGLGKIAVGIKLLGLFEQVQRLGRLVSFFVDIGQLQEASRIIGSEPEDGLVGRLELVELAGGPVVGREGLPERERPGRGPDLPFDLLYHLLELARGGEDFDGLPLGRVVDDAQAERLAGGPAEDVERDLRGGVEVPLEEVDAREPRLRAPLQRRGSPRR